MVRTAFKGNTTPAKAGTPYAVPSPCVLSKGSFIRFAMKYSALRPSSLVDIFASRVGLLEGNRSAVFHDEFEGEIGKVFDMKLQDLYKEVTLIAARQDCIHRSP